jgi:flagellar biosynthesis regulator FlbT
MRDHEIVERAVKQAEDVLREYIRPRHQRDCGQTMQRLLAILDNKEVVSALRRIDNSVQINATIDGVPIVETIQGEEAAFERARELLADGVQDLRVIMPDRKILQGDDL